MFRSIFCSSKSVTCEPCSSKPTWPAKEGSGLRLSPVFPDGDRMCRTCPLGALGPRPHAEDRACECRVRASDDEPSAWLCRTHPRAAVLAEALRPIDLSG